jgi:hypothetical protein
MPRWNTETHNGPPPELLPLDSDDQMLIKVWKTIALSVFGIAVVVGSVFAVNILTPKSEHDVNADLAECKSEISAIYEVVT